MASAHESSFYMECLAARKTDMVHLIYPFARYLWYCLKSCFAKQIYVEHIQ